MRPLTFFGRSASAAVFLALLSSLSAVAAPRDFPFTWTGKTAAQGQSSLELWFTPRLVRTADYFRLDTRAVWTHGVASNVDTQISLDLDFQRTDFTQGVEPKFTSLWRFTTWREKSPFAVAGIGRVSLGLDQVEFEGRLVADLHIDRVVLALNFSASRSLFWNNRVDIDTRLEENLGLKYSISKGVAAGLEFRAKSAWQVREYQGTAFYVGPAMTFTHPKFWITLGAFAQVAADRAKVDEALPEPAVFRDNERFVLRLIFGADV